MQSSTNLTEWTSSPIAWEVVLAHARTNPATPGNPHYYYRLTLAEPVIPPPPARHLADDSPALTLATNTWSCTLNWSPAVDIAGQRLYCDVEPGGRRQQLDLPPLENRHRLAGLTNGQPYWLELVSVSAAGKESKPLRRSLSVEIKE